MDFDHAVALVVADQRASYPEFTERDCVQHAVDTVEPVDDGSELARAYALVLAAARHPALG